MVQGIDFEILEKDRVVCRVSGGIIEYFGDKVDRCFCPLGTSDVELDAFFRDRVVDENRVNLKQVLKGLGLTEFNAYEICKRTKGFLHEDCYWVRFPEDKGLSYAEARHIVEDD